MLRGLPGTNMDWDGYETHEKCSISIIQAYLSKKAYM